MNKFKQRMIETLLRQSRNALENREKEKAANFARQVLVHNPENVDALLILAGTSAPIDSITLLLKVLEYDPDNQKAIKGLDWAEKHIGAYDHTDLNPIEKIIHFPADEKKNNLSQLANHLQAVVKDADTHTRRPVFYRIFSRWQSWLAITFVLIIVLVSIFAPQIASLSEDHEGSEYYKIVCTRYTCFPEEPSEEYILGTIKEYDVFHTLVWGTRQALLFGLGAALSTAIIGTLLGAVSGYVGGFVDCIIMRICDAFLAFPIIAAVALFAQVVTLLSPTSLGMTMNQFDAIPEQMNFFQTILMNTDPILLALILFSWMPYTRIIHAQVMDVKKTEYVDAARSIGAKKSRILFRHILPNSLAPAVITATRDIGRMVVTQASFTFIGVGSSSAWALLLNVGKDWIIGPGGNLLTRWWIYLPITLAVVFFGFSWSFLGDEINLWLNPRNN